MKYDKKGISLISVMITVLIMAILATVMLPSGIDKINRSKLTSFNENILSLKQEVNIYFMQNDEYPVKTDGNGNYIVYSITGSPTLLAEATKKNDQNDTFYIVDLSKIKIDNKDIGVGKTIDDFYIVARTTGNVYYAQGIRIENVVYHTKQNKGDGVTAIVPTSAPTPLPLAYNYPVVPTGFTHIGSENWENGFTIQDTNGNQFVWVPALDPRVQGNGTVDNGLTFNSKFGRRNFQGEDFDASNSYSFYETNDIGLQKITTSVNKYGGFYIAKYEASDDGSGRAQSKPDMISWRGISWDNSKLEAEAMDDKWGWSTSVESYLCYGTQWDTTLQWLIDSGAKTLYGVSTDSTTWGNYKNAEFTYGAGILKPLYNWERINTGVNTVPENRHMAKGIYDLAGNLWENTMENLSSSYRTVRGGYACGYGNNPAAIRMEVTPSGSYGDNGFRSVLCIN